MGPISRNDSQRMNYHDRDTDTEVYKGRILRVSNLTRPDSTLILLSNVNINEMGTSSEFFFIRAIETFHVLLQN